MSTSTAPFIDIVLPLARPPRRQGPRVVRARRRQRLFVTTDRLSAFDRVIAGVPYKGQVLNQLAAWWFERPADIVDNHVVAGARPERVRSPSQRGRCRSR